MTLVTRIVVLCGAATVSIAPAHAQFGGMSLRGSTVGLSVNSPIGDFEELVNTGFGIALRSGAPGSQDTWSGRTNFAFDTFNGKTIYENVQFITFGFDIVHRSRDSFYQFGGFSLMNSRFTAKSGSGSSGNSRRDQDFGLTGGVGVNWGTGEGLKGFVEFAATTAFSAGGNNSWFPVRIGLRF